MAEQDCKSCGKWLPLYHGVGQCRKEGTSNAKFWVTEGKQLLTVGSFGCSEWQAIADSQKDTI